MRSTESMLYMSGLRFRNTTEQTRAVVIRIQAPASKASTKTFYLYVQKLAPVLYCNDPPLHTRNYSDRYKS